MKIIINGDDLGASERINAAILQAHREGVLTSASLIVRGDAVEDAVVMARATPTLSVGLHLVVVEGRACLSHAQIPHLVDRRGHLPADPVCAGLYYFFSRIAQEELEQELQAQFDYFVSTRLSLAHVNGHLHMHMHPTVFRMILPLAQKYGASGVRLPRDDLKLGLSYDRRRWGTKIAWAVVFGLLSRDGARRLPTHRLRATDRVYGLMQTGAMRQDYVLRLLRQLSAPTAEFYFHPTTAPVGEPLGPNPADLETLLSPQVRRVIEERQIQLATYPTLDG